MSEIIISKETARQCIEALKGEIGEYETGNEVLDGKHKYLPLYKIALEELIKQVDNFVGIEECYPQRHQMGIRVEVIYGDSERSNAIIIQAPNNSNLVMFSRNWTRKDDMEFTKAIKAWRVLSDEEP